MKHNRATQVTGDEAVLSEATQRSITGDDSRGCYKTTKEEVRGRSQCCIIEKGSSQLGTDLVG